MKIISSINYKGGVGKTTLTANLCVGLAMRGKRILMVDMDPQASLTFSFIKPEDWSTKFSDGKTIKAWFDNRASGESSFPLSNIIYPLDKINRQYKGKIDLIMSHLGLINVDLDLATELGGGTKQKITLNFLKVHSMLKGAFEKEINNNEYDYIIIDCPPNFNVSTKNAIVASDHLLIPAKPDYLSTLGIDYLLQQVKGLKAEYNESVQYLDHKNFKEIDPKPLGVIFTMVEYYGGAPIAALSQYISQTKKKGIPLFTAQMRDNKTLFSGAPAYGEPVIMSNSSQNTHKAIVQELNAIVDEFMKLETA